MTSRKSSPRTAASLLALTVAGLSLTACDFSSESEQAERRYEITRKMGTSRDQCTAAREVQAAYLAELNQEEYQSWNLVAGTTCLSAQLDEQAGRI